MEKTFIILFCFALNSKFSFSNILLMDKEIYDSTANSLKNINLVSNKFLTNSSFVEVLPNENMFNANEESSSNRPAVSCYWVNTTTLEVWDISALKRKSDSKEDLIIEYEQRKIAYNFCDNTLVQCSSGSSQVAILQSDGTCAQKLAGKAEDFNLWQMRDPNNNTDGVKITMNPGESCMEKLNHLVIWDLKCNDKLKKGQLERIEVSRIVENPCFSIKISAETAECKKKIF
jgi:hypothetical protein